MKITKDVQAQARRLMRLCTGADGLLLEDRVRECAAAIAERKPRNGIALLTAFTEMVRAEQKSRTATVTSAVPLTDAEKTAIEQKLSATHTGLIFEWQTDPALIAGLTVRVGDEVTDASVRSRIDRLSRLA